MKFIRDMISERAEAKNAKASAINLPGPEVTTDVPNRGLVDDLMEVPAPGVAPPRDPAIRSDDRTMTRLSAPLSLDDDDVFKRLLGEKAAQDDTGAVLQENSQSTDQAEENLFSDWDDDEDAETPAEPQSIPMKPLTDPETHVSPARLETYDQSAPKPDQMITEPAAPPKNPCDEAKPSIDDGTAFSNFEPSIGNKVPDLPTPEPEQTAKPDHGVAFTGLPGRSTAQTPEDDHQGSAFVSVPAPASGRSGRGAGRVKTRLLGFGTPQAAVHDPFAQEPSKSEPVNASESNGFPVGWLVVTEGPGRGTSFALQSGVSQIGRGQDQAIRLDFGDTSISRSNHAAIAYDDENDSFYLGHGGKANMVRLNDRPVLSTEDLNSGAIIRIGETTMRFVALCDGTFKWSEGSV